MSMDRESRVSTVLWKTATESETISSARYAWQSIHFPATFVAGSITYEIMNEADTDRDVLPPTEVYSIARDDQGAALPAVAVGPGDVVPVPQWVNFCRGFRIVVSSGQIVESSFSVVNKT